MHNTNGVNFLFVVNAIVVVLCVHVKFGHEKQGGGIHTLADRT